MYSLIFPKPFNQSYRALVKGNKELEKRISKTLKLLLQNPFYPSLKTHRVNTRNYGQKWSSWITGDLRLVWDFHQEEKMTIILLAIGKHSGKHKAYK